MCCLWSMFIRTHLWVLERRKKKKIIQIKISEDLRPIKMRLRWSFSPKHVWVRKAVYLRLFFVCPNRRFYDFLMNPIKIIIKCFISFWFEFYCWKITNLSAFNALTPCHQLKCRRSSRVFICDALFAISVRDLHVVANTLKLLEIDCLHYLMACTIDDWLRCKRSYRS